MVRTRSRGEMDGQQVLHHPSTSHLPTHESGLDGSHHFHHSHNPQDSGMTGPPIPSRRGEERGYHQYQMDPTGTKII